MQICLLIRLESVKPAGYDAFRRAQARKTSLMQEPMEDERYKRLQEDIQYCREQTALDRLVQVILAPTGFGSNSLADTEDPIGLDYREMADCLEESDRRFFEREIDLLLRAHRQLDLIRDGLVPDKPVPVNPWEMFM